MKRHIIIKASISAFLLSLIIGLLINHNLEKVYKFGEYVPSENAYFVEKIDDPAGFIEAHKFITPTDNKYNTQKLYSHGANMVGDLENTWSSYTGKGTTVAIIDDGFDYTHPEYTRADGSSAILSTSRYYYASGNTAYFQKYSDDPTCIAEDWDTDYSEWATHGTCTSTTAAAPINNGGGVGIAPDADILALKIDFTFVAIKAAIQYAISQEVDVINMSLGAYAETFTDGWGDLQEGGSSVATYLNSVCQDAYNAGIIVVAAAGNESTWHKSYPACNSKVIGVGALEADEERTLAAFTNYVGASQTGEINVDILAPGYVYTAHQLGNENNPTHSYNNTQGTSFSSPIVAGAACLWKQKYPSGTPAEFLNDLQSSASDIGYYKNKMVPVSLWGDYADVGPSNIEAGRLNVGALLEIDEPFVSIRQSSVNLAINETKQIDLDTYNGVITYSIANTNVATVSNSGLVTAISNGETTLTVTATKNAKTDSVQIPVVVDTPIGCTDLSINPSSITLDIGDIYEVEPTLITTPNDATRVFLFESSNPEVATIDIDTGHLEAISSGETTITIVSLYGSCDTSLTVTVNQSAMPSSWNKITTTNEITNGDYLIVYESGNKAFNGSLDSLDVVNNNISVSISNSKITCNNTNYASRFSIQSIDGGYSIQSASGYYIGRSANNNGMDTSTSTPYVNTISISSGNATITSSGGKVLAFNTANDQQRFRYVTSGTLQLYKAAGAQQVINVTGISVSPTSLTLTEGEHSQITATITPNNATNKNVSWSSSNTNVATVSNGTVSAIAPGNATITATSEDGSYTATCTVAVNAMPIVNVTGVALNKENTTIEVGGSETLVATVAPNNATNKAVTWASSNTSIATVSNGVINAIAAGNTTITITTVDGGFTDTCAVEVVVPTIEPFDIVFKTGNGDGSQMSTSTPESSYLTSGGEYISSIASTSKTYYAGSSGLKLGASSSAGSLVLNLEESVTVESIVVNAKQYNGSVTLSVNGSANRNITSSSFSNYTFNIDDEISSISLSSSKYMWISKITVNAVNTSDKVISAISATYNGEDIYVGEDLDESDIEVTASFTDSVKYPNAVLKSSDYSITGFNSESAGNKTVTITYTGSISKATDPLTTTVTVRVINDVITNVEVVNNTTYHPGETITKNDLSLNVTYQSGKVTHPNDFDFENYMFTYEDASSGGALTSKELSITYLDVTYNFNVNVSRLNYQAPSPVEYSVTGEQALDAGVPSGTAGNATDKDDIGIDGITYAATHIYVYVKSNVEYISFGKDPGEIHNITPLNRPISSIDLTILSGARTDKVISVSTDGNTYTNINSVNLNNTDYYYFKVAYTNSSDSYSNIRSIDLQLKGNDTSTALANYLMYEDTTNQCLSKTSVALDIFNNLTTSERNTFMTSNNYVISTARERLIAWARHENKEIVEDNGDYVISSNNMIDYYQDSESSNNHLIIVISLLSIMSLASYSLIKNRKEK